MLNTKIFKRLFAKFQLNHTNSGEVTGILKFAPILTWNATYFRAYIEKFSQEDNFVYGLHTSY